MYSWYTQSFATKRMLLNKSMAPKRILKDAKGAMDVWRKMKEKNFSVAEVLVAIAVRISNGNT